jgi:hypothetical protein
MTHSSRANYETTRTVERISCAAIAAKWGVAAVGRDYPQYLSRTGADDMAGEWYVICNGARRKATASEARELDRAVAHGVHAIGPVYAAEASDPPTSPAGSAGLSRSSHERGG